MNADLDGQRESSLDVVEVSDGALRGRALRFVLVDELRERGTMRVAEMVVVLAECGFELGGRASKVISDALRWELARGRVERLGRGVYRYRRRRSRRPAGSGSSPSGAGHGLSLRRERNR